MIFLFCLADLCKYDLSLRYRYDYLSLFLVCSHGPKQSEVLVRAHVDLWDKLKISFCVGLLGLNLGSTGKAQGKSIDDLSRRF